VKQTREMAKNKNTLTVSLMASSLVLLLVLQFFWLRGAYMDAQEDFSKETNSLFRNTIITMHDTLIQRNLEPLNSEDSLGDIMKIRHRGWFEKGFPPHVEDSTIKYINITERNARIEIFAEGGKRDSIGRMLRPMINKIQAGEEPRTFILRLGADTLNTDSIRLHFSQALDAVGIKAPFDVIVHKNEPRKRVERKFKRPKGIFVSETVHINPLTEYAVSFTDYKGLLLKEITPQILFSIFLTLLTAISFYVMYKNMRSQQRLMEIKNDFISNVTHELKTPVATVSVTLEALRNFDVIKNPKLSEEYLEIAQRELKRLNEITNRILKTSVLERDVVITEDVNNLDKVIEEVMRDMKLIFDQKKAKVSYQKKGEDFSIHCDSYHLYQVVENLIDNALKYSTNEPEIELHLAGSENTVQFSVRDHGIGIEKDYQSKIFEKFFRVPTGDVHTVKGYGLGLSYVHNLVKSLGGNIVVESEPQKGSKFTLTFPRVSVRKLSIKIGKV
jgi:two-component system, OmpR family, phosphate regulon sensor histidine kinase PhoR